MCQKSIFVELGPTVWLKLIDRMAIFGQQKMLGYCIRDKIRFIKSVFYDIVSEALKLVTIFSRIVILGSSMDNLLISRPTDKFESHLF